MELDFPTLSSRRRCPLHLVSLSPCASDHPPVLLIPTLILLLLCSLPSLPAQRCVHPTLSCRGPLLWRIVPKTASLEPASEPIVL